MSISLPQAPAGWYRDPELAQTLRYWDGHAWTEHRSPDQDAPPAAGAPVEVSDAWAWVVALSPLLELLVVSAAPGVPSVALGALLVAVVAAVVDVNLLARHVKMGAGAGLLAFFLPPLYLVLRTVRAKSTPWIPITWVAALALVLALAAL